MPKLHVLSPAASALRWQRSVGATDTGAQSLKYLLCGPLQKSLPVTTLVAQLVALHES